MHAGAPIPVDKLHLRCFQCAADRQLIGRSSPAMRMKRCGMANSRASIIRRDGSAGAVVLWYCNGQNDEQQGSLKRLRC